MAICGKIRTIEKEDEITVPRNKTIGNSIIYACKQQEPKKERGSLYQNLKTKGKHPMKSKKLSKFIAGVMSVVMTFCCVFVPAFAADCDHMGNNFIYRDNGNGTHNVVCNDCGEAVAEGVACTWEGDHACICGSVKPACDHMGNHFSYSDNGNGTHDVVCDDCNETISANVQCVWEEGTACICGSVEPVCDHMGNHFSYSDNGNGTHDVICDDCNETISANVQCVWEGDHSCVCGSEKPVIIPRELKTVIVKFLEDKDSAQEEVAASIVVNKDDWALMQGSVYSKFEREGYKLSGLSLIHISEPTRLGMISYAVFCLKKKKKKKQN